ncbi:NAD(P)/FAD-dependent oxidoreductase, partial [Halegenticoccus soli]|uniref:NAD(P)/FAD-dependent oxidoreductase n=1 Tax=Halegenticoccus soli TaxID=1985678 RepID=UPI000C6D95BB
AKSDHPPADRLYDVSPEEARDRFPALGDVPSAIYYENAGRVDGTTVQNALLRAGATHGLETVRDSAERITVRRGAVTGVVTENESYETSAVVIAGGAWSSAFGEQLNARVPVEPQRGQLITLDLHDADTSNWPIVTTFGGYYFVPWPDNRIAVGATRETGSGFAPHTTAAGVREVLQEALSVAPGLAEAAIDEINVGLRPLSADGLPVIGPVPSVDGAYLATGHGPTGLQLGPYTGKIVADMLLGKNVDMDISAFSPARFA